MAESVTGFGLLGKATGETAKFFGDKFEEFNESFLPTGLPNDDTLHQDKYDFTQRIFPSDLIAEGSFNHHWMLININVKDHSAFRQSVFADGTEIPISTPTNELSKVDALRANIDQRYQTSLSSRGVPSNNFGAGFGAPGGAPGDTLGPGRFFVPRRTRRIVESIGLFMPNTQVFTQMNDYEDISLTSIAKDAAGVLAGAAGLGQVFDTAVGVGSTIAGLGQTPVNPRIEVLFSGTPLREFQFDFLFSPANETETQALREIIKTIRFHAAPEANNFGGSGPLGGIKGLLWVPPSEFDITFMQGSRENVEIPRINTCALTQSDVDYAPSGIYSTFSNGAPVKVRLQLRFRELEVLHKLRVLQGF